MDPSPPVRAAVFAVFQLGQIAKRDLASSKQGDPHHGRTDGVGKAVATEFARHGARLTIVGRNKRGDRAGARGPEGSEQNQNFGIPVTCRGWLM